MPSNPRSLPASPSQRPCVTPIVWPQLPDLQRRQCQELLTQLLTHVMHGESSQERSHEHQD